MSWLTRKFDNLGSACCGAGGGMGLSQAPAFTQAYLQRLGGHLDEARRAVSMIERGDWLSQLGLPDREAALAEFSGRVVELEQAYRAISEANPLLQPVIMLQHADQDVARRAWEHFTPAIPVDAPSLVYTGVGIIVALLIYELIKTPALLFRRKTTAPS
ncbi:DUF2937 family protein [Wenzhouxiangella sp. AB-CW3]|uniref:DUF2937 family protein n=1 Tax=Wenzhouxiangella sp. AB-CW3 TaxID=2771012 RepID=UPI00168BB95A|nr:DUF2937 family protein [Wenzhouxiangella sp. AB-CW3]QOC23991.1 DUF2937 family protein [Wenzhouxiangella sp. AB-CW3]